MDKAQKIKKEIEELDKWIKTNPDSRELKRAIAVKLSLQGWTYQAIAPILNVSLSFIGKWKTQFEDRGIAGLKLSYQGAKSYLDEGQKQEVFSWLQQQEYWDISELECYLIDQFEVAFKSQTSYYSLLKEAKIIWRKAQPKNPLQDPELVKKKNQKIQDIITGLLPEIKAKNVVIYTIDEVHLLEEDLISHLWGKTDKRLKLPLLNPKNRQTYHGALNLINPELITGEYKQGNGDCTVDFLKKLIKINPGKRIIIFWDVASYHRGELIQGFLAEVNEGLAPENWKITCHLFAHYAPEENPIEAIWLSLKTLVRRCYRFCKNFRNPTGDNYTSAHRLSPIQSY